MRIDFVRISEVFCNVILKQLLHEGDIPMIPFHTMRSVLRRVHEHINKYIVPLYHI